MIKDQSVKVWLTSAEWNWF